MIFNGIFCLFLWVGFLYLQYENPFAFNYFLAEDWWGEYATFVSYMLAFGLTGAAMIVDKRLKRPGFILMALGFLFIAMEEISWGYRLFNIKLPYAVNKLNYQSELNFHNAVGLPFLKLFSYVLIVWIFVLPVLSARIKAVGRFFNTLGVPMVTLSALPCFLIALCLVLGESLINVEPGELMLGLAFLFYTAEIFVQAVNSSLKRSIRYPVIMCYALASVIGLTGFFVVISSDTDQARRYNWRLYYSAAISYPEHKLYNQAGTIFEYMINNPAFKYKEDFLLEYGEMLQKAGSPKAGYILRKALEEQRQFMKEKPDQARYYRRAGKILILLDDAEQAGQEFQTALIKDRLLLQNEKDEEGMSEILFSMGKTYLEMGDYVPAVEYARKAFSASPIRPFKTIVQEWIEAVEKKYPLK